MSIDFIKQSLGSVKHPITSSLTLPPACYHDEKWLGHEMDCLFHKGWIALGREDQWKNPGDFEALNVGNIPLVVTRDENGELHGMSNTCLHRSSEIMSGKGSCKAMICPFHGWSYDFFGNVISAPRMETAEGFSEKLLRLKQFEVAIEDGFVFLSLEENPDPLEHWLGNFSELHQAWSFNDLVTGKCRTFDVQCNWKLFIEVFNEYYHLPFVHPDSIGHMYSEPDGVDDVIGEYISQFGITSGNPALLDETQNQSLPVIESLNETQRNGTRYTWVYPNMTFAASMDCLWIYHVYPLSTTRTRVVQTVCFPSETTKRKDFEEKAKDYYNRIDLAISEDIPALERQQIGMESPYSIQGRFSALEPCVANFACWYADATTRQ